MMAACLTCCRYLGRNTLQNAVQSSGVINLVPILNVKQHCKYRLYSNRNPLRRKAIRVVPNYEGGKSTSLASLHEKEDNDLSSVNSPKLLDILKETSALTQISPKEIRSKIPTYEKLKETDERFTKMLTVLKSQNHRDASGKILLEGIRLINDAIQAGVELQSIYFSKEETLADIKFRKLEGVKIFKVLYKTLSIWSGVTTCPGIMGVFKRPSADDLGIMTDPALPVTVLCSNISNPQTMGAIVRNAAAAGCRSVLVTKGCVDVWMHKVLRIGCGAHFRIPIVHDIEWSYVLNYIPKDATFYLADDCFGTQSQYSNDDFIYDEELEDESEKRYQSYTSAGQKVLVDESYLDTSDLKRYRNAHLQCQQYSSITFPKNEIVLYVGGEDHKADTRAVKLACEYGGQRIKIPLENGVHSLNSSFSLAIILYEIKRQLTETYILK